MDSTPKLKNFLDTDDTFKYAETDVLLDTEERIEDILNSFSEPYFQAVKKQFEDKIRDICSKNTNDKNGALIYSRIVKGHIKAYKINIIRISYDCNSKNYCLWIYGNKNIYTQDSPFSDFAKDFETEADNLLSKKKYIEAIRPLEKACKIFDISKNFESFKECRQKLVNTRGKSDRDFYIGVFIGLAGTAILYLFAIKNYPFEYPSSEVFFTTILKVHSVKVVTVLTKILNVILNYVLPYDICIAVFGHCIRDKIKNKIIRFFLPALLIVLYTGSMTFMSTNLIRFKTLGFVVIGILLLVISTIVQLTIKIPYQEIPKNKKSKSKGVSK